MLIAKRAALFLERKAALGWENLSMLSRYSFRRGATAGSSDRDGIDFDSGGGQRGCQCLGSETKLTRKVLKDLVGPDGFEPSTNGL